MYDERRELLEEPAAEELAAAPPGELDAGLWESAELLAARGSVADAKSKVAPPGVPTTLPGLLAEGQRLDGLYFAILARPLVVDIDQDDQLFAIRDAQADFERRVLDNMEFVASELRPHAGTPQVDDMISRMELLVMLARCPGGSVPYSARIINNGGAPYDVTFQDRSNADAELQAAVRRGPPP